MKKTKDGVNSFEIPGKQAGSVHSELSSLIRQIQGCITFTEETIATVASDDGAADDFFILDDVTPHHALVNAGLTACHTALNEALGHSVAAKTSNASPRTARAA